MEEKLLSIQEAAKRLKVSTKTLRRWEERGVLVPQRTDGNHRRYSEEQIMNFWEDLRSKKEKDVSTDTPATPFNITEALAEDARIREEAHNQRRIQVSRPVRMIAASAATAGGTLGIIFLVVFLTQVFLAPAEIKNQEQLAISAKNSGASKGNVLAASTADIFRLHIKIPTEFTQNVTFLKDVTINGLTTANGGIVTNDADVDAGTGQLTASNVIYSITAGSGIGVTPGQNPTISNTGVLSLQGSTGAVTLTAGSGISISGTTITNTAQSGGGGGSGLTSAYTEVQTGATVMAASGPDKLTFTAGNGITITPDTTTKTLTFDSTGITGPASSTDNAIARWDGATGLVIQNSGIVIDDTDNISGIVNLNLSGTITDSSLTNIGGVLYTNGSGVFAQTATGSSSQCLLGGATPTFGSCGTGGDAFWNQANGALFPNNSTVDLLIGSQASTSAKFAVLNVNTGTPVASISANSGDDATFLTGDGNLGTTNMQDLTIGGPTTGHIFINSDLGSGLITLEDTTVGPVINATSSLNTGAGTGTSRIDSAGNLVNIGTISSTYLSTSTNVVNVVGASTVLQMNSTTVIDASRNLVNINNITAGGTLTLSSYNANNNVLYATVSTGVVAGASTNSTGLCLTSGATAPSWTNCSAAASNYWQLNNNALSPANSTYDVLFGGTSTASAKFAFINNADGTPTASISANSPAINTYLTGLGNLATTNMQTLTLGGTTTGNIVIDSGSGLITLSDNTTVTGNLNLTTGNAYLINNTSVLNATTLGSGVLNSSLTQVGALASGSIVNGFGTITTANTITGTTLNGTTGINTGAGAGTQRIDVSGNLVNIGAITAGGAITFSTFNSNGGPLYTNGSGVLQQVTAGTSLQCLLGGTTPFFGSCATGSDALWQQSAAGALFPNNLTVDLLVGGTSTASAKFAFINVLSGTPTASISASSGDNATFLTGTGILGTTNMQSLTLGGATTGTIILPRYNGQNGVLYGTQTSGVLAQATTSSVGQCLVSGGSAPSWADCSIASSNFWQLNNNALSPTNSTWDVLFGATATTSAKFAFINNAGGTPTASISANSGANATTLSGLGVLGTTNGQSLTLGNSTTGNVVVGSTNNFLAGQSASKIGFGGLTSTSDYLLNMTLDSTQDWSRGINITQANDSVEDSTVINIANTANLGTTSSTRSISNLNLSETPTATIDGPGNLSTYGIKQAINLGNVAFQSSSNNVLIENYGESVVMTGSPNLNNTSGSTLAIYGIDSSVGISPDTSTIGVSAPTFIPIAGRFSNTSSSAGGSNLTSNAYGIQVSNSGNLTTTGDTAHFGGSFDVSGSADNNYGLYVNSVAGATNNYGLYLSTIAATATNYSIYSNAAAQSYIKNNLGLGTTAPISELHVTRPLVLGANGKALAIFDQIENQDILTASFGGTTKFTVENTGTVDIASGATYQINNIDVLSSTTLGTGVVTSSLTTVGALASGSIATGFGNIVTNNPITGTTLNGTTGINTGGGSGTQRIDSTGNLVNIGNITAAGTITFSALNTAGGVLYTNGSGVVAQTATSTSAQCLLGGTTPAFGSCNPSGLDTFWNQTNGALYPNNSTVDLLIGAQATTSANFAVLNNAGGTPTATVAGNFIVMPKTSGASNLGGLFGIGTTAPTAMLDINNRAGFNNTTALSITQANTNQTDNTAFSVTNTINAGTNNSTTRNYRNLSLSLTPTFTVNQDTSNVTPVTNLYGVDQSISMSNVTVIDSSNRIATLSTYGDKVLLNGSPTFTQNSVTSPGGLTTNTYGIHSDVSITPTGAGTGSRTSNYTTYAGFFNNGSTGTGITNSSQNQTAYGIKVSSNGDLFSSGTHYGANITSSGAGLNNYGIVVTASGATNNQGLQITGIAAGSTNYAIYSDASAQSYIANNLGLGTTTPISELHVTRPLVNGVNGKALVIFDQIESQDILTGSASGTTKFVFNNNGNLGIGTSLPLTALDVTGSASMSANLSLRGAATAHTFNILDNGTLNFQISPGGDAGLATAMFINSRGNVGIGTASPATTLNVAADKNLSTGGNVLNAQLRISGVGNANQMLLIGYDTTNEGAFIQATKVGTANQPIFLNGSGGNVGIGATTTPLTALDVTGSASMSANLSLRGSGTAHTFNILDNGTLNFQRSPGGDAGLATAMFIDSRGNVGLGVTSPLAKVHVEGPSTAASEVLIRGPSGVDPRLELGSNESGASIVEGLDITYSNSVGESIFNNIFTGSTNAMRFQSGGTDRFIIKNAGGILLNSAMGTGTGGNYLCVDTTTYEVLRGNGSTCTASSQRFKHDIASIPNSQSLSEVLRLRPVSFIYNSNIDSTGKTHLGFVAEEVNQIEPRLVTYESDGTTIHGLDYENFAAILAGAIQEQDLNLTNLGDRVTTLQNNSGWSGDSGSFEVINQTPSADPFFANYEVQKNDNSIESKVGAFANIIAAKVTGGIFEGKAASLDNIKSLSSNIQDLTASTATVSGTLFANKIVASEVQIGNTNINLGALNTQVAGHESRISFIEGLLDSLHVQDIGTDSGSLTALDNLMVSGSTSLSEANIVNNLTIGNNMSFTDSSINTIGSPLEIQPLAQADINFLGGKIKFDSDGKVHFAEDAEFAKNVEVKGVLSAKDIAVGRADAAEIITDDEVTASGSSGLLTLKSGQTQLKVNNSKAKADSVLFITPKTETDLPLYIKTQANGSFTIGIKQAPSDDIPFNFLIVN